MDANTWNTRRLAGVVVSISSAIDREPVPRADRLYNLQKVFQRPGQAVVFCNGYNVAITDLVQHTVQLGPFSLRSADLVSEHLARSCCCQRVGLGIKVLVVSADASVVEVVEFRLAEGANQEDFMASVVALEASFLCNAQGYVSRTLTQSEDGVWLDMVY